MGSFSGCDGQIWKLLSLSCAYWTRTWRSKSRDMSLVPSLDHLMAAFHKPLVEAFQLHARVVPNGVVLGL